MLLIKFLLVIFFNVFLLVIGNILHNSLKKIQKTGENYTVQIRTAKEDIGASISQMGGTREV